MRKNLSLLLLFIFIFLARSTFAQQYPWGEIETNIFYKRNLTDLQDQLSNIRMDAILKKDDISIARSYFLLMVIADKKTEDTLFFRNSIFIDSILTDKKSSPLLRSLMYVLNAKRIEQFRQRYSYSSRKSLFVIPAGTATYPLMRTTELDSLVQINYDSAKMISKTLASPKADNLLWLSSDPLAFLFQPDYTDIIFGEKIHFESFKSDYYQDSNSLRVTISPNEFFDTSNRWVLHADLRSIYDLYREWAMYHSKEKDKFYFIDALARKFFYRKLNSSDSETPLYENYLTTLLYSPYGIVRVMGIHQLAFYWSKLGEKYHQYPAYNYSKNISLARYEEKYRDYFTKSLSLIEQHAALLDSFTFIKNELTALKETILEKHNSIQHADVYSTKEPLVVTLSFQNTETLYLKIVRLNNNSLLQQPHILDTIMILRSAPVASLAIELPVTADHQQHTAAYNLDALSAGHYAVLFSDSAIGESKKGISLFTIDVSDISSISNAGKLFALDRMTGQSLSNATAIVTYQPAYKGPWLTSVPKKINKDGSVIIKEENPEGVMIINGTDSLLVKVNEKENKLPEEIYNKEDDKLVEYYKDNIKVEFFTDRSVYRPGQTVFFKGIVLMRDPATGKNVVLNKENFKLPFVARILNNELKDLHEELLKDKIPVYITDAFDKVDTLKFPLNDYGSFSGSVKLSKTAATGNWGIETDFENGMNSSGFKVEEYKRPTFELKIDQPKIFLALGDSFIVKVKANSFAGTQLNNVRIDYEITASLRVPSQKISYNSTYKNFDLADTSGFTNDKGELELKIPAAFLSPYLNTDGISTISYSIDVKATDATGETHNDKLDITLNSRPVTIVAQTRSIYERKEPIHFSVTAKNTYAGNITRILEAKLYRKKTMLYEEPKDTWSSDYQYENRAWKYIVMPANTDKPVDDGEPVFTKTFSTDETFILPDSLMQAGDYVLKFTSSEKNKITGELSKKFSVFDEASGGFPQNKKDFHYLPVNSLSAGEKINWYFGTKEKNIYSVYHAEYFSRTGKKIMTKEEYFTEKDQHGISKWTYEIPVDAIEKLNLTHLYIFNNKLYKNTQEIYLQKPDTQYPEIIVEQYRQKMLPGGKDKFVVTIKTSNHNIAAELMSTMYDASLDKIEEHKWRIPNADISYYLEDKWDNEISSLQTENINREINSTSTKQNASQKPAPLWWINPLSYDGLIQSFSIYQQGGEIFVNGAEIQTALQGRVSGLNIVSSGSLSEVVVTMGFTTKKYMTGSVSSIRIRGAGSLTSFNIPLTILDGNVYEGDLSKIDLSLITDAVVLKGADASAIYGSRASSGVIVLSTKGLIVLPQPEAPVIKTRKDFSETAFFVPQLHADKNGFYNISFTMPESVTEWNWKMMAHTKNAEFMYLAKKIVTQLPMMVQPNMPRFLYQGDLIKLQTRISNLDTTLLNGNSFCKIEDAVTGEDITAMITASAKKSFTVAAKTNETIGFELKVPDDLLHPLTIKITAQAGSFSDGEEYTIPILSRRILAIQNVPFTLSGTADTTIQTPVLPADAQSYGVSLYIQPKTQAALANALPYLAFYPYGCAEQTFNKILAHSLAIKIMQTDSSAQKAMKEMSNIDEQTTVSLPEELSEETMPWLQLNNAVQLHQQQLVKIFDTLSGKASQEKYLTELTDMQKSDGGITWFKGGPSNFYISCYILNGLGGLKKDSLPFLDAGTARLTDKLIPSLISYCDAEAMKGKLDLLHFIDSRSYWKTSYPLSASLINKIDSSLRIYWKQADNAGLARRSLLIETSMRYQGTNNEFTAMALKQLESIRQLAINDINGIRWKDISNKDDFDNSEEETVTSLAMAFESTGTSAAEVNGIIKWLLKTKQQHNWSTTKSTAAAVGLLYRNSTSVTDEPITLKAEIKDSSILVTDNLLKGQLTGFKQLRQLPPSISLNKTSSTAASGGLNYYYFTTAPPLSEQNSMVNISKQIYRMNASTKIWEPVTEQTILKIADKIKTDITIFTTKQLKYVFIDEKRAASMEPEDGSSGYVYGNNCSYYSSVRDAGYQFFAENILSGNSVISYETVVAKEGVFYYGPVSLQCMYQPQVRVYGGGGKLTSID